MFGYWHWGFNTVIIYLERPVKLLFWGYSATRNRRSSLRPCTERIRWWGYKFWDDSCRNPRSCGVPCRRSFRWRYSRALRYRGRRSPSEIHYWHENCTEEWSFVQLWQLCSLDVILLHSLQALLSLKNEEFYILLFYFIYHTKYIQKDNIYSICWT